MAKTQSRGGGPLRGMGHLPGGGKARRLAGLFSFLGTPKKAQESLRNQAQKPESFYLSKRYNLQQ